MSASPAVPALRPSPVDIDRFRRIRRSAPRRPYETLMFGDVWVPELLDTARRTVEEGWSDRGRPFVPVQPPVAWEEVCAADRSWEFHLHCWDFLGPVLSAFEETGERRWLEFAITVALDWCGRYPDTATRSRSAWYDMAVGVRAYRLAYILDCAARELDVADEHVALLLTAVGAHQDALESDGGFAAHSNHGFYQAAGHLALSRRFLELEGMDAHERLASARLAQMVDAQFTDEGVHREHSPDYHRMVLGTLHGLARADLLESVGEDFLERVEDALAWFVIPDGTLAQLGDSTKRQIADTDGAFSEHLRFVASSGRKGAMPQRQWEAFLRSGYAVFRAPPARAGTDFREWSYLLHNCAFHSRTHKHADDLSFVWYDRGQEILVDPGRYGYLNPVQGDSSLARAGFYYGHPARVYVESTRAHNTVEIDGRSYQRRGVRPYGSALMRAGGTPDLYFSEAHAYQFGSVRHARVLLFRPSSWLLVFDWLHDNRPDQHDFRQWFTFAPEVDVARHGEGWACSLLGDERLWVSPLLPATGSPVYRGETEPAMQGWVSRQDGELEPASSVCSRIGPDRGAVFATLFWFGESQPSPGSSKVAASGRRARFAWTVDETTHEVKMARPLAGALEASWRVGVRSAGGSG